MGYQYETLSAERRLAQCDSNLEQLEALLFQSEMSLRMNEWRAADDPNLVALREQYDQNLKAVEAVKAMKIEIGGNGIIDAVAEARTREAPFRELVPNTSAGPA